jgi:hypothetical protein
VGAAGCQTALRGQARPLCKHSFVCVGVDICVCVAVAALLAQRLEPFERVSGPAGSAPRASCVLHDSEASRQEHRSHQEHQPAGTALGERRAVCAATQVGFTAADARLAAAAAPHAPAASRPHACCTSHDASVPQACGASRNAKRCSVSTAPKTAATQGRRAVQEGARIGEEGSGDQEGDEQCSASCMTNARDATRSMQAHAGRGHTATDQKPPDLSSGGSKDAGELAAASQPPVAPEVSKAATPAVFKADVRQALAAVCQYHPSTRPTRGNLKQVFQFLRTQYSTAGSLLPAHCKLRPPKYVAVPDATEDAAMPYLHAAPERQCSTNSTTAAPTVQPPDSNWK